MQPRECAGAMGLYGRMTYQLVEYFMKAEGAITTGVHAILASHCHTATRQGMKSSYSKADGMYRSHVQGVDRYLHLLEINSMKLTGRLNFRLDATWKQVLSKRLNTILLGHHCRSTTASCFPGWETQQFANLITGHRLVLHEGSC